MLNKIPKIIDIVLMLLINLILLNNPWYISIIVSVFYFLGIYSFRLYDLETMQSLNDSVIRITAGFFLGTILVLFVYPFFDTHINRYLFINNAFYMVIFFPFIHKIEYLLFKNNKLEKKYLVIGKKDEIGHILKEIEEKTLYKLRFVEYINPSPNKLDELIKSKYEKESLNHLKKFVSFLAKENNSGFNAILVTDPRLEELVKDQIENYKSDGIEIEYLPKLAEKYLKRIPLEVVKKFEEYYTLIFEENKESPAKRILDVFSGTILMVIFSPFIMIFSLLIYLEDGNPIIFTQKRVGKNEKTFTMKKLRSLKNIEIDPNNPNKKIDQGILKVGKITRKFRIDESIQFLNVIQGTMSLVGPRPEMMNFIIK
ncbi:sugar transferase [Marinitoga arctica]